MNWPVELFEIGQQQFLSGADLDVFVNFYLTRFPYNRDSLYAAEWARRFRMNYEMQLGDKKSRQIITDLRHPFIALTEKGKGYK